MRRNLWLAVLVIAVIALSRVSQSVRNGLPSGRTEPQFAYDLEGRPITATLSGPQFGDDEVMRVATIPWVYQVNLADSHVTQRGLASLSGLPKLKSLDLSRTTLTDQDFLAVTKLTTLTELFLNNCPWLKDEHLGQLAELKQLKWIEFSSPQITAQGLLALGQFPELKMLAIGDCSDFNDEVVTTFRKLSELKTITFSGSELLSQTVFSLQSSLPNIDVKANLFSLKDLRSLTGKGLLADDGKSFTWSSPTAPIEPGDMAIIGSITPLNQLSARGPITDEMFRELTHVPHLRHLQLLDSHITDDGLEHLAQFPELKSLSMFPTRLTGRGLVHLRNTPQLERLELRVSQGDEVLEYFAPLQELREIVITAPITDAGLERLPVLPKLRSLWLNDSNVTGPGLVQLAKQPELVVLSLGRSLVDDSAVDAIAKLSSLRFVHLRLEKISEEGKVRLREMRPDLTVQ